MIRMLMVLTYVAGGVGVALGFSFLGSDDEAALTWLTVAFVVVMGAISWVRHVPLSKADARALGIDGGESFFQWEVGFANGAFAVAGAVTLILGWGTHALGAVCVAYAAYLLQAAVLHGWRYVRGEGRSAQRLWGSFLGLGALCVMSLVIVFIALSHGGPA